jgi:hypothetical protein
MEIRNPVFTAANDIDCEINHPVYGWIPFTAALDDVEQLGRDVYAAALAMNPKPYEPPAPYVPTPEERIAELKRLLAETDYVALSDYDKEKPEVFAQRQAWRDEIRVLEAE